MSSTSLVLLPFPHLEASARCFDNAELRRQTVLSELVLKRVRHGSSRELGLCECMWLGYSYSLVSYVNVLKRECAARGYSTSPIEEIPDRMKPHIHPTPWFGDERVHFSHQAILLRRNPKFYARFTFGVSAGYPVVPYDSHIYRNWYQNRHNQTKAFDFSVFGSAGVIHS